MLEGGGMPEPAGKTLTEDQVLLIAKAARYQALKYSFRGFLVYVKRLRIELNRECLDLRLVDRMCRTGKAPTGVIWRILAYVVGFPCGLAANQDAGA